VKISTQRKLIGGWLHENFAADGVKVGTVSTMRKMWQEIFDMTTTSAPKLVVCFDGATARGGFERRNTLDREDRQWVVALLKGRGLVNTDGGDAQLDDFEDFCEEVRDVLRRLIGISEEAIDYVSLKPLPGVAQPNMANVHLDGFVITFTTANDIPAITTLAPGQEPE
jgi:hypothetical protein